MGPLFLVLASVGCAPPERGVVPSVPVVPVVPVAVAHRPGATGEEPKAPPASPPDCPPRQPAENAGMKGAGRPWERLGPLDFIGVADPRCAAPRYNVAQLAAVITAAHPALSRCSPSTTDDGATLVEFLIDRSGVIAVFRDSLEPTPTAESIDQIVDDPSYRACLGREIYRLTFPAPEEGNVLVRAPFSRAKPGTLARRFSP